MVFTTSLSYWVFSLNGIPQTPLSHMWLLLCISDTLKCRNTFETLQFGHCVFAVSHSIFIQCWCILLKLKWDVWNFLRCFSFVQSSERQKRKKKVTRRSRSKYLSLHSALLWRHYLFGLCVSSAWRAWLLFMCRLFPTTQCWAQLLSRLASALMNLQRCVYPWQVDIKNQGKTALQVAAHQGHMEVVKALLQANGSVEVKDEDGDTALHYTAFG